MTYRVVWSDDERCASRRLSALEETIDNGPRFTCVRKIRGVIHRRRRARHSLKPRLLWQLPDGSIGDLRFALTPDNPNPLWVWVFGETGWTREARRDMTETDRAHFKSLWLGQKQLDWTSEPVAIEGD